MSIRLRHVAAINPPTPEFEMLPDTAELPFLPLEAVWPGNRLDTTRRQPKAAVSSGYTRFREGDILLPKITPTFQADRTVIAKGIEGGVGAGTTELHVVRAGPDADVRYLRYLLSSKKFLDEGEASMIGVAGQKRVPDDCLRDLVVPVVDPCCQRAIADYLDRETTRIDALIEKKQRLIRLLEERFQRLIDDVIWSEVHQPVPLMRRVQWNRPIMYGIVLPGPDVPDGVPIVKGGDVAAQRLSPDRLARTTPEIEAPFARARLHEADLVFAIRGGIGDVELVPPELEGANITQDVARVAPAADVDPKWLRLVLRSAEVRRQVEQRVTGATIKGLNIWDLKRVCVPPSGEHRQRADLASLSVEESRICQLVAALGSQSSFLAEHRQALITAAVTGQLAIPEAAA